VDHGVSIARSVILDSTYIGSHTEIKDAVIKKNAMINVPRSTNIYVEDDFSSFLVPLDPAFKTIFLLRRTLRRI